MENCPQPAFVVVVVARRRLLWSEAVIHVIAVLSAHARVAHGPLHQIWVFSCGLTTFIIARGAAPS
jgi:hypothetical protein